MRRSEAVRLVLDAMQEQRYNENHLEIATAILEALTEDGRLLPPCSRNGHYRWEEEDSSYGNDDTDTRST